MARKKRKNNNKIMSYWQNRAAIAIHKFFNNNPMWEYT